MATDHPLGHCPLTLVTTRRCRGDWSWHLVVTLILLVLPMLAMAAKPADNGGGPPAGKGGGKTATAPATEYHGDCAFCHLDGAQTTGETMLPEPDLCKQCHMWQGEHVILVSPTLMTASLPLNTSGEMTCITCHDHHGTEPLILRLTTKELCAACHDN